ncbi:MAG TPA: hypothetical protein VGL20_04350 [Candidatus Dormibacteraeota bacterium]|jgi:uncharacterized membrane protein (DUF441 family)
MSRAPRPDRTLTLRLGLIVLAAAVVTPVVVAASRPLAGDWADTVGFTAGVAAACVAIRGLLRRLGAASPGG